MKFKLIISLHEKRIFAHGFSFFMHICYTKSSIGGYMKDIKYIIWDWNGTLLNDVTLCIEAVNRLLAKEGLPMFANKEAYQRVFQFPIIEYYKKAGFDFQKTSFDVLADEYMSYYQPRSLLCTLHEGATEVLENFHKSGYKQAILSASKLENLKEQVNIYDISKYFNYILGLDNIHAHSKAQLAKDFVMNLGIDAHQIVFIGDSVHDSEVAKGAGCNCILIANGHEHKDKLLQVGCPVVDCISDVYQMIKG